MHEGIMSAYGMGRGSSVTYAANRGVASYYAGLLLEQASPGAIFRYVHYGGGEARLAAIRHHRSAGQRPRAHLRDQLLELHDNVNNLWDDPPHREIRQRLIRASFDARVRRLLTSAPAGVRRCKVKLLSRPPDGAGCGAVHKAESATRNRLTFESAPNRA